MGLSPIAERVLAVAVAVAGGALTTVGSVAHVEWLKAPGATAAVAGAVWLGLALARQNVRLFPNRAGQTGTDSR